jgi:NitT/TauT family transport system permease protein
MSKFIKQLFFYAAMLAIWQAIASFKIWPEYVFPSPLRVCYALADGFMDKSFIIAIATSMRRILVGYLISIMLGFAIGVLMGKFKLVDDMLSGLILGLQTLPSICWLPLALIWFGLNERAIIFVVIMGALFSITIATESSIKNTPSIYTRVGKNIGAHRFVLLREVIIPAAFPHLLSGLKQGWSFAWRSLMAGELLFASMGLGYLLMMGRELNDMSQVMAVMIIVAALSILVDRIFFGKIESDIRKRWGVGWRVR